MHQVSIIIVNYNTCKITAECIDSVFEKTKSIDFEVILIDNASEDGSKEFFEKDSRIHYVYNNKNIGFGRANNVGMQLAKGRYLFLLNSDTLLVNNAIKYFYDYAETHEKRAFYGCWLKNGDGKRVHSCARIPCIKDLLYNSAYTCRKFFNKRASYFCEDMPYVEDKCVKTGYVTGADMFLHRSVYEEISGFDENIFMYYEDAEWQRRAKKQGIESFCINGPEIVHLVGGSQTKKKWTSAKYECELNSKFYYVRKGNSLGKYLLFRFIFFILEFPKIFLRNPLQAFKLLR